MRVLGIDPGAGGALALRTSDSLVIKDMPSYMQAVGKSKRKRVDAVELCNFIEICKDSIGVDLAVIEAVGGRPKQSAPAAFVFGYTVGMIYMALISHRIPIESVPPGVWKRMMKCPADKEQAVMRADEIFPDHRELFRGKKGGTKPDRAEAAMIAEFGRLHIKGISHDTELDEIYRKTRTMP